MSQVAAATTTPLVTVTCAGALTTTMTVTAAPTSMGLAATLDHKDVILLPPLNLADI